MQLPERWKRGPRPDASVIELLESLAIAARKGHIRAISVVTVNPLLEVETAHAGDMDHVKTRLLVAGLVEASRSIDLPKP